MTVDLPTREYLLKTFSYLPNEGLLIWNDRDDSTPQWNAKYARKIAGTKLRRGRVSVTLGGRLISVHRIIWKMIYGTEPNEIDHIDCDGQNNRLNNLRECTRAQNMQNRKGRAQSGFKGVTLHRKSGLWHARIYVNKKTVSLGYFHSPDRAHAAYAIAAQLAFGQFARAA